MKTGVTEGSFLVKTLSYAWNGYCRCVDRFETVFMRSSVKWLSKKFADIMSTCLEWSFLMRISSPSNGHVYSGSILLGSIKGWFCKAGSLIGSYYEGSCLRRVATETGALFAAVDKPLSGADWGTLKENSRIIGIFRRCSRKR